MLSPPLLPLSHLWSHAAMEGARRCSVAVPSLSLTRLSNNLFSHLKEIVFIISGLHFFILSALANWFGFTLIYTFSPFQAFIHPFLLPWLLPILQISLNGSIWATVSVAIERFISIVHPRFW